MAACVALASRSYTGSFLAIDAARGNLGNVAAVVLSGIILGRAKVVSLNWG